MAGSSLLGGAVLLSGGAGRSYDGAVDPAFSQGGFGSAQGFGTFVATAGDVDGDGLADVLVWAGIETTDPQEIALYRGADKPFGAAPSAACSQYEGSQANWLTDANLLACAGDVNGDGYTDVVVSTPAAPTVSYETDHLTLFFGGPSGPLEVPSRRLLSPLAVGRALRTLRVVGIDVNGDGLDDLGVTSIAPPPDSFTGLVFDSSPGGPVLASQFRANDPLASFEREIGSPGDIDGDGFADILVGYRDRVTPGDGGTLHGAVEVHAGSATGASDVARWTLLPPDTSAVAYGATLAPP